jgi:hypothetical protein
VIVDQQAFSPVAGVVVAMGQHGFSPRPGTLAKKLQAGVPTGFDQAGGTLAAGGPAGGIWRDSRLVGDILYRHNQADLQF